MIAPHPRHRLPRADARTGRHLIQPVLRRLYTQVAECRKLIAEMGRGDLYGSRLTLRSLERTLEPVTDRLECRVALDDLRHLLEEE